MNTDVNKKYAVYLTELDWLAVLAALKSLGHDNHKPSVGFTVWTIGRDRLRSIANEIEANLPPVTPMEHLL